MMNMVIALLLLLAMLGVLAVSLHKMSRRVTALEEIVKRIEVEQAKRSTLDEDEEDEKANDDDMEEELSPALQLRNDTVFMQRVTEYIEAHIMEPTVHTDDLALSVGTSRAKLFRKMKKITGMTPNEYVREARIKKARMLLERSIDDGGCSVAEVAYKCGFTDAKYFSRSFKLAVGLSPTEYRAEKTKRDTE